MRDEPPARETGGSRRGAWLAVAGRFLTPCYLAAAVLLLAWGAERRFRLPQQPLIDPDILGYLGPAISALAGKPFPHLLGRSFPYPAFVYLILRLFGDFRAICVVQHLLGLAAGGLVLLAWNAAVALTPAGGIPRPLFRCLGLLPAYICLGSATAITFEHEIRPEAIFPFLAILNIWVSLLFLDARFIRRRPAFLWLGALNVFVSLLIYMAKPSFGFATLFCTLPVWVSLFLPGASARQKAALAAWALLPGLLLLFLPEHILKSGDPTARIFLPETLFTVHAAIIERQMTEDLAGAGPLPYPRGIVQNAHDLLAVELDKAAHITMPKTYPSLGFNPDYLMYHGSFCAIFPARMHFDPQAMADFCMTYYRRALLHHPGAMAAKTLRQLAIFYRFANPVYRTSRNLNLSADHYARVAELIQNTARLGPANAAMQRYIAACAPLAAQGIIIPQGKSLLGWLRLFSVLYLELLGVALLSPLLLLSPPLRAHFLWLVVALWLAYGYNFGNSLTIAVVHSLDVARYVRIQMIFTAFAESLSLGLLVELVFFRMRAVRAGAQSRSIPGAEGSK